MTKNNKATKLSNSVTIKNNKIVKHIKQALFASSLVCTVAMSTPDKEPQDTTSPHVQIIDQQQIIKTGLTSIGDIINELVISNGDISNRFNNNIGSGPTTVNFGALGSNRVLVLLNGKRLATDVKGNFDFSSIPLSIVKHIEINQTNATDAISAVINIITRSGFTGIETNAYYGKSSRSDAETQNYNISIGKKTEKASVFFNAEYSKNAAIFAGNRNISALPVYGTGNYLWSSATPQGRFLFVDQNFEFLDVTTTPGSNGFNSPNDPDLIPFTDDSKFNYAPVNFLLTPQQRKSIFVETKYHINEKITAHAGVLFSRKESFQQYAPAPLIIGLLGNTITNEGVNGENQIGVGANNPYNPYGYDLLPEYNENGLLFLGRRMIELGNRTIRNTVDSYNLDVGLTGTIVAKSSWDWSIGFSQSNNDTTDVLENYVNLQNVAYALSNECVDDITCVPLNLFGGVGSITPEMIAFIKQTAANRYSSNTVSTFQATASSILTTLAAGDLTIYTGLEHRQHSGNYRPSSLDSVADYQTVDGSYNVNEAFVDLAIPLLDKLKLNVKTKYSKFDFTEGVFSGSVGFAYQATDTISINLDYAKLINPPSMYQLYMQEYVTYNNINDICVGNAQLPGCANAIDFNYESFTPAYVKGNNKLEVEKSNLISLNIKYKPEFIKGLELNLYGRNQRADNLTTFLTPNQLFTACAYTGESLYCDGIIRSSQGFLQEIRTTFYNNQRIEQSSIGFDAIYKFNLGSTSYNIKLQNMYIQKYSLYVNDFIADRVVENSYVSSDKPGAKIPRLKTNLSIDMIIKNISINYQLRYVSGYEEVCNPDYNANIVPTNDPNAIGGVVASDFQWCTYSSAAELLTSTPQLNRRHVGGATFQDINFKYDFPQYDADIMLGVENIFDKTPPLSAMAFSNSYNTSLYNGTGRLYWFRLSKRF